MWIWLLELFGVLDIQVFKIIKNIINGVDLVMKKINEKEMSEIG